MLLWLLLIAIAAESVFSCELNALLLLLLVPLVSLLVALVWVGVE